MSQPLVSVIIAVKNSQGTIDKCLDSVLTSDYTSFEVIVVDDGSTDKTPEILQGLRDKISIITNASSLGPAQARNIASQAAHGEFLAFTDGDCIVDRAWIKGLLSGFTGGLQIAACGGMQRVPEDASLFEQSVFLFMQKMAFMTEYVKSGPNSKIHEVFHNPSCTVMYRKDIFLKSGGFCPGLWPGEDVELDYRLRKAGLRLMFNPKALVYHYRPKTFTAFTRMMKRYGAAQGCLLRKYGFFRKVHVVPFITASAVIVFSYLLMRNTGLFVAALFCLILLALLYMRDIFVAWLGVCAFVSWHAGFFNGFIKRKT
jgi:succinoglycan biosynthesis protein ExoA